MLQAILLNASSRRTPLNRHFSHTVKKFKENVYFLELYRAFPNGPWAGR
jgi:hypothetical protein